MLGARYMMQVAIKSCFVFFFILLSWLPPVLLEAESSVGQNPAIINDILVEQGEFNVGYLHGDEKCKDVKYYRSEDSYVECSCTSEVHYPNLRGKTPQIKSLNDFLKKIGGQDTCTSGGFDPIDGGSFGSIFSNYKIIYNDGKILSIVFDIHKRASGGQGSCHSQPETVTLDLDKGSAYHVVDLVDSADINEIRNELTRRLIDMLAQKSVSENIQEMVQKDFNIPEMGFYIENGKIMVNMKEYWEGCAGGNFYPVEFPKRFVRNKKILGIIE